MLTVRSEQIQAVSLPLREAALVRHAFRAHPAAAAALTPAGIRAVAATVLQRCIEHRLVAPADQLRMMDLALVFGPDWQRPDLAWLDQALRESDLADPGLRLRRLWRRALRRLARGS